MFGKRRRGISGAIASAALGMLTTHMARRIMGGRRRSKPNR